MVVQERDRVPCKRFAESSDRQGGGGGRRGTKVRELFERQGADAAWVLGLRLGLKESTLHNWFARWRQKR